jgi:biotin transport system substrate-specific component
MNTETSPNSILAPARISENWGASSLFKNALMVLLGSALIAICSQIRFYLPHSPIPVSGQTFAVLLVGGTLGWRRGALAVLSYWAEGAMGLPVFAGGLLGAGAFISPSAGYLWGFLPAAVFMGFFTPRKFSGTASLLKLTLGLFFAETAVFGLGIAWLWGAWSFSNANFLVQTGFLPFLPGEIIKVALVAMALPGFRKAFP